MNANLTKLLITAGALYAAYKYGPNWMAGLAMGAAGFMLVNNMPVLQDGLALRYDTPRAAA